MTCNISTLVTVRLRSHNVVLSILNPHLASVKTYCLNSPLKGDPCLAVGHSGLMMMMMNVNIRYRASLYVTSLSLHHIKVYAVKFRRYETTLAFILPFLLYSIQSYLFLQLCIFLSYWENQIHITVTDLFVSPCRLQ